jgi:type I restriction enzyme S subunit
MKRWPIVSLENFVAKKSGSVDPAKFPDEVFDLYSIPAFDAGQPDVRAGSEIGSAKQVVQPNDVLLSRIVPHIRRAWVVGESRSRRLIASGEWIVFRSPQVRPRYLRYFLVGDPFHAQFMRTVSGVGGSLLRAKATEVAKIKIPVPSLEEQARIVKLLDEADELRKLRAQADRRAAALIPALFHDMFGDPGTNSKGWPVKPFGDLASNQDGRRKPVKASDRAGRKGEYPYYGASGIIDYVEEYLFDETALLIGEDGANLLARSTPIAFLAHGKYWVNNHAHVVTDNGKADLNYLCAALNLRDLTDYVTGSAQPKLNQANMNRMPIPVPPLPLQKEFAARVSEIRALQAVQAASRRRLDELFQSLLHRAFQGEL